MQAKLIYIFNAECHSKLKGAVINPFCHSTLAMN
jgi:hypothetical protein